MNIEPDSIYLDCTFGRGGHSLLILSKLNEQGRLFAIDRDPAAIEAAQKIKDPRFTIIHGPFSAIVYYMNKFNLLGQVKGIIFDLGVSSPQIDDPQRGFSFMHDGPLDMRMDTTCGKSAAQWLLQAREEEIALVLKKFGEEHLAKRIAKAIIKQNKKKQITNTHELAELISNVIPCNYKHKNPATRTFQAIRIYINSELEEIERALNGALTVLAPGGRLSVISFHSLEDRLVKSFIRQHSGRPFVPDRFALTEEQIAQLYKDHIKLKFVGKMQPSAKEINNNPRARSSLLRCAEKLSHND